MQVANGAPSVQRREFCEDTWEGFMGLLMMYSDWVGHPRSQRHPDRDKVWNQWCKEDHDLLGLRE
jgi:hypothetical protein